jgi:hypothetical protein
MGAELSKDPQSWGFSADLQTCLDDAAGDPWMMGCSIFYKKCQEVNTVAT